MYTLPPPFCCSILPTGLISTVPTYLPPVPSTASFYTHTHHVSTSDPVAFLLHSFVTFYTISPFLLGLYLGPTTIWVLFHGTLPAGYHHHLYNFHHCSYTSSSSLPPPRTHIPSFAHFTVPRFRLDGFPCSGGTGKQEGPLERSLLGRLAGGLCCRGTAVGVTYIAERTF